MKPETAQKPILVSGYYGYSNTGDEAILQVILAELRRRLGPDTAFTVISGSPELTQAHLNVTPILWSDTAAIAEAVGQARLVVTGGGGIFHDYGGIAEASFLTEGNWGIGFHSTAAILAGLFGKPMAVCAVGVGPLLSGQARLYTQGVFTTANYACVRDAPSRLLAIASGVPAEQVQLTADPAFLLRPASPARAQAIFAAEGIPEGATQRVVIAIRHWSHEVDPEAWETPLAQGLDQFAAAHPGTQLVFVPFQRFPGEQEDDLTVARRVRARLRTPSYVVEGRYAPEEIAALLAEARMGVAMRLHAAIFCAAAGVPFVAITYDGKVRHLLERVERPWLGLPPGELTGEGLNAAMLRAWSEPVVDVEPLREQAAVTFDRIAELARNPRPAELSGPGRELLRQGVLALTAREKFLRNWLTDQQTNYEYMVRIAKEELEQTKGTVEATAAALAAEQQSVAQLRQVEADLRAAVTAREGSIAVQTETIAERDATIAERDATIAGQAGTIAEHLATIATREAALTELQAQLADEQAAHAAARQHHAGRESAWTRYAAEMQSKLATYRSQRAWRVMLAARRAYTVATRRGVLHLIPYAFQLLTGKGNIESEQLIFPLPPNGE